MKNSIKDNITDTITDAITSDEQAKTHTGYLAINWVGMSGVQSAIADGDLHVPAKVDVYMDLKSGSRGIHMSRLYMILNEELLGKPVTFQKLSSVLKSFILSQEGLSQQAKLKMSYEGLVKTQSLKSGVSGFRSYPIEIEAEMNEFGKLKTTIRFVVTYSSTCPQSAKLSKEFLKNTFKTHEELISWYESDRIYPATPHAQRSTMTVELQTANDIELNIPAWILTVEEALKTTVQTAVKKADEMEFARLNAENTMFCEDAVRVVAEVLDKNKEITGYRLAADHFESLHSHNASSIMVKSFNCN
jgi:GTP cyclohydrolase I